jgi:hypothetical protein
MTSADLKKLRANLTGVGALFCGLAAAPNGKQPRYVAVARMRNGGTWPFPSWTLPPALAAFDAMQSDARSTASGGAVVVVVVDMQTGKYLRQYVAPDWGAMSEVPGFGEMWRAKIADLLEGWGI